MVRVGTLAGPFVDVLQYLFSLPCLKVLELSIVNEPQALCACLSEG